MSTNFDFNLSQQIYCLSSASNAVGGMYGTEADLQKAMDCAIDSELPKITGNWKKAWGPRVFKRGEDWYGAAENVWFAAVDDSQKHVVVAVAGTAPVSIQDWLDDINVKNVVNFDGWVAKWDKTNGVPEPSIDESPNNSASAYCAYGTATGVYNVLNNTAPEASTGNVMHLWEYLKTVDPSYTIVFTGHSMGGAIVPTLALGLNMAGMAGTAKTFVMPSAGPTPGNSNFVSAYTARYPPKTIGSEQYQVLNADLFNLDDIVPQAWSLDVTKDRNITRIVGNIYTQARVTSWFTFKLATSLVYLATRQTLDSRIKYEPIPGTSFDPTKPRVLADGQQLPPLVPAAQISSLSELFSAIYDNHIWGYWRFLGVDEFVKMFEDKVCEHPGVDKPESSLKGKTDDAVVSTVEQHVQQKLVQA